MYLDNRERNYAPPEPWLAPNGLYGRVVSVSVLADEYDRLFSYGYLVRRSSFGLNYCQDVLC